MVGISLLLLGALGVLAFGYLDGVAIGRGNRRAFGAKVSAERGHSITGMSANRIICKCGWNYKMDSMLSLKASRAQDLLLDNWNEHERQVRGIK